MAASDIFLLKIWNKTILIKILHSLRNNIIIRFLKYCYFNILDLHMHGVYKYSLTAVSWSLNTMKLIKTMASTKRNAHNLIKYSASVSSVIFKKWQMSLLFGFIIAEIFLRLLPRTHIQKEYSQTSERKLISDFQFFRLPLQGTQQMLFS